MTTFQYYRADEVAADLEHADECDIKLVVSDILILYHFGRVAFGTGRIYPLVFVLDSIMNF